MAISSEWDEVEIEFSIREKWEALRPSISAMRRLAEKLKSETRILDVQPSVSLGSLVFRRKEPRSVWVSWDTGGLYQVSLVAANELDFLSTTKVDDDGVVDVIVDYLDRARASDSIGT